MVEYAGILDKMHFARKINNGGSATETFTNMRGVIDNMGEELRLLMQQRLQGMQARKDTAVKVAGDVLGQTTWAGTLFLAIGGISILVTLVLSFFVIRGILRVLGRATGELKQASTEASSASSQVSSASQSLAQGASEQAAAIEETTSSMEEMTSMTKSKQTASCI